MTIKEIQKMQDREAIKFETAKAIRMLLDERAKAYKALGGDEWSEVESQIIEMVTAE